MAGIAPSICEIRSLIFMFLRNKNGADGRDRTCDLLVTNELLYQLSYIGIQLDILYHILCYNYIIRS